MAAEVGRHGSKPGESITRDFLGGFFGIESKELDLDLHVPTGWEKRLDLKSGKVYIQQCNQPSTDGDHKDKKNPNQTLPSSNTTLKLFEGTSLSLKSVPNLIGNYKNAPYQSVCTLDKVKSALERAWRVSSPTSSTSKKRPSPSNSASSSMILIDNNGDRSIGFENGDGRGPLVAAACPSCLLYVLISESNPKCPKCNSVITLNVRTKKPKIDLNVSF